MKMLLDWWCARGSAQAFCRRLSFEGWERLADLEQAVVVVGGLERVGRRVVRLYRPELLAGPISLAPRLIERAVEQALPLITLSAAQLPSGKCLVRIGSGIAPSSLGQVYERLASELG
jgi:hypothetical protein